MIEQLIIALTPLIVLVVGELVKWLTPRIKGVYLLLLVGSSSAVIAFITQLTLQPELAWIWQFTYGLLAVFVNQFYKQWKSGN